MGLAFIIVITTLSGVLISSAIGGSYFQLTKYSEDQSIEEGEAKTHLVHKSFFQCERELECTHVVKIQRTQEYRRLYGKEDLKGITDLAMVWEKMSINKLNGKIYFQLIIKWYIPYIKFYFELFWVLAIQWDKGKDLFLNVFSCFIENIALGKPAQLSSLWKNGSSAALAVDGIKETSHGFCAESALETNGWLRVDLIAEAIVRSISILSYQTKHRTMKSIDIRAGGILENGGIENPPCQLNTAIPINSSVLHVNCPDNTKARYVTVNTHVNGYLEICEIEVFGYFI